MATKHTMSAGVTLAAGAQQPAWCAQPPASNIATAAVPRQPHVAVWRRPLPPRSAHVAMAGPITTLTTAGVAKTRPTWVGFGFGFWFGFELVFGVRLGSRLRLFKGQGQGQVRVRVSEP